MLWPGYYAGKVGSMPEPILTEIPKVKILPGVKNAAYDTANCSADLEEYAAGDTVFWFFPHDEMHYALQGEANLEYSLASTSHTVKKTAHVSAGDFYVIPTGARVTWKIPSTGAFQYVWIAMPGIPRLTQRRGQAGRQNK